MKDKSKKLLVINTNKKPSSAQPSGGTPSGGGFGGVAFDMSDYLLKAVWDRVFELKTDKSGAEYLFSKLPLATQYGITMYADGGELNLPDIYEGIPFDNKSIWYNPETKQVEVLGGNGSSGEGGVSNFWDLNGIPEWITITKPTYNYSEIKNTPDLSGYVSNEDLKKYVSLNGDETINGLKNFTKGLQIDGLGISKSQDNVIYLDANLVVRGGITMYGIDSVDVPTIMDAIATDNVNLQVINGVLTFVGEATGGVADSVRWENVIGRPTLLSSFTNDAGYLTSHQTIYNLTLQAGTFSAKTFDPNGAAMTVNIPTTTSHISEGSNLYFTNARAVSALSSALAGYLPLSGGTITGSTANPLVIKTASLNSSSIHFYDKTAIKASVGYNAGLAYIASEVANGKRIGIADDGLPMVWTDSIGTVKYQLAYITSNVASATKLVTARTIWGQGFDGTANVDGNLLINVNSNGSPFTINDERTTAGFQTLRFYRNGVDAFGINWFHDTYNGYSFTSNCLNIGSNTGYVTLGMWTSPLVLVDIEKLCVGINKVNPLYALDVTGSVHSDYIKTGNALSVAIPNYINSSSYHSNSDKWHTFIGYNGRGFIFGDDTTNNIAKIQAYKGTTTGFNYTLIETALEINNMAETPAIMRLCVNSGGTKDKNPNIEFMTGFGYIDWHYEGDVSVDYTLRIIELTRGVLQVSGNLLVTGGITMYSDIRKKTILNHVELSLKQIAEAPLIEHYYNSDESKTTHVGSIAQYWASLNDWFCKKDNEGFYTMEIQNAALASAISIARELVKYESKTDKKIRLLKKRIGELEDEIEKLKRA